MGSEIDLMNSQEHYHRSGAGFNGDCKEEFKEQIFRSYDLPLGVSYSNNNLDGRNNDEGIRDVDDKPNSSSIVSEIERTLKKHTDNLLHTLQGVSARLANLEITTSDIERSVDDLKVSVGSNCEKGRLRKMENILTEVQEGLQILREKQETTEALRLAKLQASKGDEQSQKENGIAKVEPFQGTVSIPEQSHQLLMPPMPPLDVLPSPFQQNHTVSQPPKQLPTSQISSIPQREPYVPAHSQQYQPVHQHYQPHQQPQQHPHVAPTNPSQLQPLLSHLPKDTMYMTSLPQSYPPSVHQSYSTTQPITMPLPAQQYFGAPSNMHEYMPNRQTSGFYESPSVSNYYNTDTEPPQISSLSSASDEKVNYPQLPTAQILPRSLSSSSRGHRESSTGGTETSDMKIDDVIDKVVMMGFSRDQVTAITQELIDNGQKVDLNMVLDKLMKDGEIKDGETKRKKGWFGR